MQIKDENNRDMQTFIDIEHANIIFMKDLVALKKQIKQKYINKE